MKNNKSKKRKFRLLLLIFLAIITLASITTSTYAWFTANKTVTVGTLTVNVEAQNGIQISADGTNWKSTVQTDDLKGVHNTTYQTSVNQIPAKMEPVSTIGEVVGGKMKMFYGATPANVSGDYIITATAETDTEGTNGRYIAYDLFFKVTAPTDIYLTPNSGVKTEDVQDKGIKNASRFGFVVLGNIADGSSITDIQGLNSGTQSYIWEPNYDVHSAAAVSHARDNYGVTTTETGAARVPYAGIKATIAEGANVIMRQTHPVTGYTNNYSDYFQEVTPAYTTKKTFTDNVQIFSLQAGITKVRIYMWVEGQDVDCENNASGGTISYDLQITTE